MLKLKSFNWKAERFLYVSTRDFFNANSVMSERVKQKIDFSFWFVQILYDVIVSNLKSAKIDQFLRLLRTVVRNDTLRQAQGERVGLS